MFASDSIAARCSGRYRLIPWILFASTTSLVAGLLLPVMEVDRFFMFTDRFSIWDSVVQLMEAREYFLSVVIFVFTFIFPVIKLVYAGFLWARIGVTDPSFDRHLRVIETLGKWSMLDVLLLAIAVASIKMSVVGAAHANPGLYLFSAAILLAMVGAHWLKSAAQDLRSAESRCPPVPGE